MKHFLLLLVVLQCVVTQSAICRSSGTSTLHTNLDQPKGCDSCSYVSQTNSSGNSCMDCFEDCAAKGFLYICCCGDSCCCYDKGGLCVRDAECPENTCY